MLCCVTSSFDLDKTFALVRGVELYSGRIPAWYVKRRLPGKEPAPGDWDLLPDYLTSMEAQAFHSRLLAWGTDHGVAVNDEPPEPFLSRRQSEQAELVGVARGMAGLTVPSTADVLGYGFARILPWDVLAGGDRAKAHELHLAACGPTLGRCDGFLGDLYLPRNSLLDTEAEAARWLGARAACIRTCAEMTRKKRAVGFVTCDYSTVTRKAAALAASPTLSAFAPGQNPYELPAWYWSLAPRIAADHGIELAAWCHIDADRDPEVVKACRARVERWLPRMRECGK